MALDKSKTVAVCAASMLLRNASHVLSRFELELVSEIGFRVMRHGADATVTDAEWPAFEAALEAMCAELGVDYRATVFGEAA